MLTKVKFSKIAIVGFLTVLIWVYADMALDETHPVPNVSIGIVASSRPELWATFSGEDESPVSWVTLKHIVLKGPTSKIAEVKRELSNGFLKLSFSLNPEYLGMTTAGSHTLAVLDFLRKSTEIRELGGLTVESCEPDTLTVNVEVLEERTLTVQCFDQGGRPQEARRIEPETVTMFVPESWGRDRPARLVLRPSEIEQARAGTILQRPYIALADGQRRQADTLVRVRLLPQEEQLATFQVGGVNVGLRFSPITQNHMVQFEGDDEAKAMSQIAIRATQRAKEAYEAEAYKVTLDIYDLDRTQSGWVPRQLRYNFPDEFVRLGEIELDQDPVEVRFKLVSPSE
ncbi:MAG: YbbR-like domain-containing protein [Planctomycetota bacterium]|jgi:hypothetical protein